jgi:acyl-CoA dehydrogenase
MISFQLTEEQSAIREAVGEFAVGVMQPLARDCDENSSVPEDFLGQVWELGLTTTQVPEAFGGLGAPRSPVTNAVVLEELARGDAGLAVAATVPSLFVNAVLDHGTEEQKKRLLPALCGDRFATGSLAVVEPGAMPDAARPKTTAEKHNGGYRLNGTKRLVPFADRATHFLVVASADDGPGVFVVERDASGLSIEGEPDKNLGLRAVPTHTLTFNGVEVSASDRLGGSDGCDVRALLDGSRTAIAACLVGISRAVLDYCVPYAKDRVAFDEAIAKKQAIAFLLAESHMEVEAMRWLTWQAASLLERGENATKAAFQAWSYAGEKGMWVSDNGIQVLGGHGFIREHPVELWFRHARTLGVLEGTASI